jgi:hypothetical protein
MRPLHEQRAMIDEAKNADQKAATAEPEQALYRTRAMTSRPRAQAEPTEAKTEPTETGAAADHNDPSPEAAPAPAIPKKPA